jgi:DNA-directed RNA polymerase specialized sigma24 family protein
LRLVRGVAKHCVPRSAVADVVQDTIEQILRSASPVVDLNAFVGTVTRRRARRYYRSLKQQPGSLPLFVAAPTPTSPSPSCRVRDWLANVVLPQLVAIRVPRGSRSGGPTPREIRVLAAIAAGTASLKQLARDLAMKPDTVRKVLGSVAEKIRALGVPPPDTC